MTHRGLVGMSEAEKDEVAAMVLTLVQEVKRTTGARRTVRPFRPEPTSTGYLAPDVRGYVERRSA